MKKLLYALLFLVFLAIVFCIGYFSPKNEDDIHVVSDTIYQTDIRYEYDTTIEIVPISKKEIIIDTIILTKADTLFATQKHYSKDSMYDAWVSGINPLLDSINVYNKTQIVEKTQIITNTKVDSSWHMYAKCGLNAVCEYLYPTIGVCVSSPKRVAITANYGVSSQGSLYGFGIMYKIF